MKRWQKGLLSSLCLVLFVLLSISALIGTQVGSRWLLGMIPGLESTAFEGKLAGSWQAQQLLWKNATSKVQISQIQMRWSPQCLLHATLCVEHFSAGQIQADFEPSAETEDSSNPLSDLHLPLQLKLGHIEIGGLSINSQSLADISVVLQGHGDTLRIERFNLTYEGYRLQVRGDVRTSGEWLLDLQANIDMPPVAEQPWHIGLTTKGPLTKLLQVSAVSDGYLDAQLKGSIAPLKDGYPARLRLTSAAFIATPQLPQTLRLDDLELTAEGDLTQGYHFLGTATLPGEGSAVKVALDALLDANQVRVTTLELLADANRNLRLAGELNWQQALRAKAHLNWADFPWQRLYPMQEPPVALRQLTASVDYDDGHYTGVFQAALDGPAGAFELGSPVIGDLQQIELSNLQLQAGSGRLSGPLQIGFAEGLSWDTNLQVHALNPAFWVAQLPGELAGLLRSSGSQQQGQLKWAADANLQGRLRGQSTTLQLNASGDTEQIRVPQLDLRLGANRIHGALSIGDALQGELQVALSALRQLWPGLDGQLNGTLALAGNRQAPQLHSKLQGRDLSYQDNQIASLSLRADLDAQQRGTLTANVTTIQLGETQLGNFELRGSGDRVKQQAELRLDGPTAHVQIAADGRWNEGRWLGQISRARLQSGAQNWHLESAASLRREANGRLDFGPHCWLGAVVDGQQPSLCATAQRLLPDTQLSYRLQNFALQSLEPWLPDDFRLQGMLAGDLKLSLPSSGPVGVFKLDAGQGHVGLLDQQQWLDLPYQRLLLTARMDARRVEAELQFHSEALGNIELNVGLDPGRANKPLDGHFHLEAIVLDVARPFIPQVKELAGRLEGNGRISGELLSPRIDGQLLLKGGRITGPELPTLIEDLQVKVLIAGQHLELDGDWRAGAHGSAKVDGSLDWSDGLTMDMKLVGARLPVRIEPYAELEAEPNLSLRLVDNQLSVQGRVNIPRGKIEVLELPPSTVQVSSDARIVGADEPESAALGMAMDIKVTVGEDTLTFSGFGLTADLVGELHIGDNLDTRGELNLKNGRYRAYGQRLTIRRARLLFAGPLEQPYLDVEAVRKVGDVTAGLRLTGSAEEPLTQVFSEPAMSQEQALSYLILGRPMGGGGGDDRNMVGQAALALGLASSASITNSIVSSFGIREFELDTQGNGLTTSVVASGKLSDRLSLRYGVGVFEPANTFALRYELTKRLYLEAASGLANSLDLFYRKDF